MLVVARRLDADAPAGGAMVAVAASEDEVVAAARRDRCDQRAQRRSPVRSRGKCDCGSVRRAGSAGNQLAVSHAFHSPLMEPDGGVRKCRGPRRHASPS